MGYLWGKPSPVLGSALTRGAANGAPSAGKICPKGCIVHTTYQPAANAAHEALLTSRQLAEILRVHHVSVRRWTVQNLIPCIRIGRSVRYRLSDVLAALAGDAK